MLFAVDVDNTITDPAFYHPDFHITVDWYLTRGLVSQEEVKQLRPYHSSLYLLPTVAITHLPKEGAINALQGLDGDIEYFTVRNHIQPDTCQAIHQNTFHWLEEHKFPYPLAVHFFWGMTAKLCQTLETTESHTCLIDDRPAELLKAYQELQEQQPQTAYLIRERVTLVAFGSSDTTHLTIPRGLRVLPFADWSHMSELLSSLRKSS